MKSNITNKVQILSRIWILKVKNPLFSWCQFSSELINIISIEIQKLSATDWTQREMQSLGYAYRDLSNYFNSSLTSSGVTDNQKSLHRSFASPSQTPTQARVFDNLAPSAVPWNILPEKPPANTNGILSWPSHAQVGLSTDPNHMLRQSQIKHPSNNETEPNLIPSVIHSPGQLSNVAAGQFFGAPLAKKIRMDAIVTSPAVAKAAVQHVEAQSSTTVKVTDSSKKIFITTRFVVHLVSSFFMSLSSI